DPGLAGWTVYVDLHHDQQFAPDDPSSVTDLLGNFSLGNLLPGTYELGLVPQDGWFPTQPTPGSLFAGLGPGQTLTGRNFGLVAAIGPAQPPVVNPAVVTLNGVIGQTLTYQV